MRAVEGKETVEGRAGEQVMMSKGLRVTQAQGRRRDSPIPNLPLPALPPSQNAREFSTDYDPSSPNLKPSLSVKERSELRGMGRRQPTLESEPELKPLSPVQRVGECSHLKSRTPCSKGG